MAGTCILYCFHISTYPNLTTASPQTMSFVQGCFSTKLIRKKSFWAETTDCEIGRFSPCLRDVFSWAPVSSHIPKCHVRWIHRSEWPQSEWVWVWVWHPVMEGSPVQGGGPNLTREAGRDCLLLTWSGTSKLKNHCPTCLSWYLLDVCINHIYYWKCFRVFI